LPASLQIRREESDFGGRRKKKVVMLEEIAVSKKGRAKEEDS